MYTASLLNYFWLSLSHTHIYIYIYINMGCICGCISSKRTFKTDVFEYVYIYIYILAVFKVSYLVLVYRCFGRLFRQRIAEMVCVSVFWRNPKSQMWPKPRHWSRNRVIGVLRGPLRFQKLAVSAPMTRFRPHFGFSDSARKQKRTPFRQRGSERNVE